MPGNKGSEQLGTQGVDLFEELIEYYAKLESTLNFLISEAIQQKDPARLKEIQRWANKCEEFHIARFAKDQVTSEMYARAAERCSMEAFELEID